jgi:hypothetical protein
LWTELHSKISEFPTRNLDPETPVLWRSAFTNRATSTSESYSQILFCNTPQGYQAELMTVIHPRNFLVADSITHTKRDSPTIYSFPCNFSALFAHPPNVLLQLHYTFCQFPLWNIYCAKDTFCNEISVGNRYNVSSEKDGYLSHSVLHDPKHKEWNFVAV